MAHAKRHFALPHLHRNTYDDGRTQYVSVYEAACNHTGLQPNATTKEDDVTCTRCRAYLGFDGHHPSPERYRTLAEQSYSCDDITIDANVRIAQADYGAWVAAWVYVADPHQDDDALTVRDERKE